MKVFKFIFYATIFLLTFGRFLPAYNAPEIVTSFFGSESIFAFTVFVSFCFFSFRILKFWYLSCLNWKRNYKFLLNSVALTVIYFSLVFSIPALQDLQNKFVIWVNQGRDIANLVNPTLGVSMYKFDRDDEGNVDEIEFEAFAHRSGAAYRLIFTPDGTDKSRWHQMYDPEDIDNVKIYNSQWQWFGNNKSFFPKQTSHGNNDEGFTIE